QDHIGFSIEAEGHARELIKVIDRLQSEVLLRFSDSANRDHRIAVVRFHVNFAKILRAGPRLIVGLDDDLILVVGRFNKIDVVLRVGGAQQALELRGRHSVGAGAIAIDLDVEVGRGAKKIRARGTGKARVVTQFRSELVGSRVNLVRINAADDVGIATELTSSGTDIDLQHRLRIQRWQNPGNAAARLP